MSGEVAPLRPDLTLAAILFALWLAGTAATAGEFHGRLELQDSASFARNDSLDAALRAQSRNDLLGNIRLTWEPGWQHWSFSLHYVLAVQNGDSVSLARALSGLLPASPATWFNLTERFVDHAQLAGTQSIDRLSLTYNTSELVIRVGRQALSWGSGLVFRPMDLFNPFSPRATDSEYKPGTDMLYAQSLFPDGSDLQFIMVPRPAHPGAWPSTNASSAALHLNTTFFGHQTTWLVARDHGDWVFGAAINGALGEATWNVELVPTFERSGAVRVSALVNLSDAVTLANRNAMIFAEYFRNGFGAGEGNFLLAALPRDLTDRLGRGQLFDTRRDYLAAGMTLELDPLLISTSSIILDLDDASLLLLLSETYSVTDNLNLIAGAQVPIGPARSEFGGMPLADGNLLTLAPPAQLYLQLRQYF